MNVDPIAQLYRWIEYLAFGRALERCRCAQLPLPVTPERVLILGEGDGRFLAALLALYPSAQVDVIEQSVRMIELARARAARQGRSRVCFMQADALQVELSGTYDLVVTNFFLDCFLTQATEVLIRKTAARLEPGGFWIVGEFQMPARGLARLHARLWLWAMYLFFRLACGLRTRELPHFEVYLNDAGLQLTGQGTARWGLLVSQFWSKPDASINTGRLRATPL